mgnify:FL=1
MTDMPRFVGSMVALVTPFRDGEVDFDALGRNIEEQIDQGTMGLVPCGTTGESPTLSHDEPDTVVAFTVEKAAGRVPVIAGTGSNSTEEALRLTRHAQQAGADGCLVVNPYYNKPTQQGLYEHVARLGEVGLPIVLYNIPGRTGIELTPDTVVRCYEDVPAVVAIKEATGKPDVTSAIASSCDITILSGDDSLTLPLCACGGEGVISVLANLLPGEIRKLWDAIEACDLAAACQQHLKLFPLFRAMFWQTNPIVIKAAMAMAGRINNELRLPMTPLEPPCRQPLAELLNGFGIEAKV